MPHHGTINFAHPDNQYPITSIENDVLNNTHQGSAGNDWGVLGTAVNSNTGLSVAEGREAFYRITDVAPDSGDAVQVTGHGRDRNPVGTGGGNNWLSQTQQTHVGDYVSTGSTAHFTRNDIWGGNSGSPHIRTASGLAFGIVTHGADSTGEGGVFCWAYSQNFQVTDVADAINDFQEQTRFTWMQATLN